MEGSDEEPLVPFLDRRAAGAQLARVLRQQPDAVVLGIARGGVIVAAAVAQALAAPLDVLVVRKVGHPSQPELAIGAVSAHGDSVATEHAGAFSVVVLRSLFAKAHHEAQALETRLRGETLPIPVEGRCVIVVDDGIATAATMACALTAVRGRKASKITCAVPVAPADCLERLRPLCDELFVLVAAREIPFAVGRYYFSFQEVSDVRVRDALSHARAL